MTERTFHADDLLEDLVHRTKRWTDLGLSICWDVPQSSRTESGTMLTFTQPWGESERLYAGVTHLAHLSSWSHQVLHVIALTDLLATLSQ